MLESLIDRIYAAAGTPDLWPDVLRCVGDQGNSDGGVLTVLPPLGTPRWITSPALASEARHHPTSVGWRGGRMALWRTLAQTSFVRDVDLTSAARAVEADRGDASVWQAGTTIPLQTGDVAVVTAERRGERGPHEAGILPRLDALRPHLVRACQLSAQFGFERARVTTTALNRIGLPAAVLAASGRVLVMNERLRGIDEILPSGQHGGIVFRSLVNGKPLQEAINAVVNGGSAAQTMPVRTFSDQRALIAHILRFDRHPGDVFDASAVLLVLVQVGAPAAPDNGLLHLLFDLTPAESRLLRALAGGLRLQSYAESVGVQPSTVRTQLTSIFNKTGTKRQAELLSVVASISMFNGQVTHC